MFEQFNVSNLNISNNITNYELITTISQHSFAIPLLLLLLVVWVIMLIVGLITGATHAKSGNFWIIWILTGLFFFIIFILFYSGIMPYNFTLPYT